MNAAKEVKAKFDLEQRTLTITKNGTGTGTVECEINSGGSFGACAASYPNGTVVKVKATANGGSEFVNFNGGTGSASSCSTSPCTFTIEANSAVTATFNLIPRTLTITKNGTGTGTVECEINSGGSFGACAASYPNGTVVKVKATANGGSEFVNFNGGTGSASSCSTSPCTFTIEANSAVTATFNLIGEKTLTITKNGTGTGTVECEINSGGSFGACAASYPNGTVVKVKATANGGSEFVNFNGGTGSASSCSTSPCTFTIEANSAVTATFNLIPRTLTITKNGTGTGTVECEINSGGSFGACAASYPNGTVVKVKATANGGSEFVNFNGGTGSASSCSTSPCTFTIEANSAVTATFNLIPRTLTITKNGTGTGTVECEINSGGSFGACAASYPNGTVVKVKATANGGSEFVNFNGGTGSASSCSTSPCTFTIEANSAVTATFNLIPRTLTITKNGTGTGTVECEINSGGSFGACAASYPNGTVVKVKATANGGSEFVNFNGGTGSASSCSTSPCTFTIEANSAVTATFNLIPRTLTITKNGTGTGTVECEINSGGSFGACAASYPNGTVVKVKATANGGSEFVNFNGGTGSASSCSTSPCTFTIEANGAVTATFNLIPRTLTITKNGTGTGTVLCDTGSGAGACAASYPNGTTVTLTQTPAAHSTFAGWSGCSSEAGGKCVIASISANKVITATFTQITHVLAIATGGSGSGAVSCNGGACASSYPEGTTITLSASPASGSEFKGWSGACSGSGACSVTINADASVTAIFDKKPDEATPTLCVVPKVKGLSLSKAKSALTKAHCKAGKVTKPKKAKGALVVKSSKPGAGASLPVNSKVNLKLGPKPKKK